MTCQGSTRLLLLIEWCNREGVLITNSLYFLIYIVSLAPYFSHGNSFHGDGGRGSKISQLRYSLRLLLSMCSTNNESVLQDLHEQGIIPLLISKLTIFIVLNWSYLWPSLFCRFLKRSFKET